VTSSLNHFSMGAVISFLHRYTAGLQPLAPGYQRFRVQPHVGGGLTAASTHHDCPYGRIEVAWQLTGLDGTIAVTVPEGTVAELVLPTGTEQLQPGKHGRTWLIKRETPQGGPDLLALVREAARHPDPWFSALARSYLVPKPPDVGADLELVARLEAQAETGTYDAPDALIEDRAVPGPHGPVPVRVYSPLDGRGHTPVLVWCHGGGFGAGDLDMPEADATSREVAFRAGTAVVSVDYRLATKGVHFPVPHDDCLAAYEWATAELGPAVIGGASAGANLAAGVALRLRDEGRPPLGVALLYPLVHPALPEAGPELAGKLARLTATHTFRVPSFTPMVENYLGGPVSEATPYAFAALGHLRGYPPTLVINGEYDGLRASGEAFSSALMAAGCEVTQLLAPEVLHGHANSPWLPQAQQTYGDVAEWLTSLLPPRSSA
jgi:acetyl esterase/lipase